MENIIILQGISVTKLMEQIDHIVEKRFAEKIKELNKENGTKLLSRKETAYFLKISLPTLDSWTKKGLISSYRMGTRILYKSDEVENSISKRRFST